MPKDRRIVYGAFCMWWDDIAKAGILPSGIPCCPICKRVLYEEDSDVWWQQIAEHTTLMPYYSDMWKWLKGRHFQTYAEAHQAYLKENIQPNSGYDA